MFAEKEFLEVQPNDHHARWYRPLELGSASSISCFGIQESVHFF